MTNLITNHELQKAVSFAVSKRCAARINEYWRAHGVDAKADVGAGGEICSKLDVKRHIPHRTPPNIVCAPSRAGGEIVSRLDVRKHVPPTMRAAPARMASATARPQAPANVSERISAGGLDPK